MNSTTNQIAIFNQQTVDDFNKHKQNTNQLNYEFHDNILCGAGPACGGWSDHNFELFGPFKTEFNEMEDWRDNGWSHCVREALVPNHPEGCVTLDN